MLRRKRTYIVRKGKHLSTFLTLIYKHRVNPTDETYEDLWSAIYKRYPFYRGRRAHYVYDPGLKELTLREGSSTWSWVPFTL